MHLRAEERAHLLDRDARSVAGIVGVPKSSATAAHREVVNEARACPGALVRRNGARQINLTALLGEV
eukprot:15424801-Alexandrium_andersonii.AAC.1